MWREISVDLNPSCPCFSENRLQIEFWHIGLRISQIINISLEILHPNNDLHLDKKLNHLNLNLLTLLGGLSELTIHQALCIEKEKSVLASVLYDILSLPIWFFSLYTSCIEISHITMWDFTTETHVLFTIIFSRLQKIIFLIALLIPRWLVINDQQWTKLRNLL